jgi:hypothetical protein
VLTVDPPVSKSERFRHAKFDDPSAQEGLYEMHGDGELAAALAPIIEINRERVYEDNGHASLDDDSNFSFDDESTHSSVDSDGNEREARIVVRQPSGASTVGNQEQLLVLHKKYMMSVTGKSVSMEYRELDARERFMRRLEEKKTPPQDVLSGDENSDNDLSVSQKKMNPRNPSASKELSKRLAVNSVRHRLSMMYLESDAKLRLQQRLSMKIDQKRKVSSKES